MNPLTGLYGAATSLRNTLFDRGVLPSRRLERPVVSVGNLSVGGSGKTPFVIALGELLKARAIRFDVLARGYRRKTRGVLVVETDGNAADFGDEPLLIARRLGVPVIVGESRYAAGRVAEQKFQPQLHILDDGFQHRSLARDFDIVLMTERDFDDRLLLSGRLREPISSLQRADAIVLPRDFSGQKFSVHELTIASLARQGKLIWRMTREISMPRLSSAVSRGPNSSLRRCALPESLPQQKSSFATTMLMTWTTFTPLSARAATCRQVGS
jgi:tetraacyldisaccharide 4'-kinase